MGSQDASRTETPAPSHGADESTPPVLAIPADPVARRVVRVPAARASHRRPTAHRTGGRSSRLQRLIPIQLVILLLTGLVARLIFFPHRPFTSDTGLFRDWGQLLLQHPIRQFYPENPRIDHLPGDMWLHLLIAHIYSWFSPNLDDRAFTYDDMIKLVPSIADLGIALGIFLIVRRLAGPRMAYRAAWVAVLSPALIFESAIWGQWDAVSACVAVAALGVFLAGRPEWSFPLLTYAVLVKPQMAALVPFFMLVALLVYVVPHLGTVSWLQRPLRWLGNGRVPRPVESLKASARRAVSAVLASVVVFIATLVPFNVGLPFLPTQFTIQERISFAVGYYSRTSFNAFNFWATYLVKDRPAHDANIPDTDAFWFGLTYQTWGNILTVVALATIAVLTVVIWRRVGAQVLIWSSCATMYALFMLPTRIHERYIFPVLVLSIVLGFVAPRLWWVFAGLSVVGFLNLVYVYDLYYDVFGVRTYYPFLFDSWFLPTISTFNLILFGATITIAPWIFTRQRAGVRRPTDTRRRVPARTHLNRRAQQRVLPSQPIVAVPLNPMALIERGSSGAVPAAVASVDHVPFVTTPAGVIERESTASAGGPPDPLDAPHVPPPPPPPSGAPAGFPRRPTDPATIARRPGP